MTDLTSFRPSKLWRRLPIERRTEAAALFWSDEGSFDQQMEAVAAIAGHMKFRPRSVVDLPVEKKARYLATLPNVSDTIAARALITYHLQRQRPMMGVFLDSLGIAHEEGLISNETIPKPPEDRLKRAAEDLAAKFPADDVSLYFATLVSQDPDTWGALAEIASTSAAALKPDSIAPFM
jgi:hypothetical protein